jgi:hypothetical protein
MCNGGKGGILLGNVDERSAEVISGNFAPPRLPFRDSEGLAVRYLYMVVREKTSSLSVASVILQRPAGGILLTSALIIPG